jgi:hypothetical protein
VVVIMKCIREVVRCVPGRIRWKNSPNEGGLRLAVGVTKIQNQWEVAIVNGDTGDIDDAGDALLQIRQYICLPRLRKGRAHL